MSGAPKCDKKLSPCWSGTLWSPYRQYHKNTNKSPPPPFPVNSDTPIVFPTPELVCSNIYMVGVPCFFAEILRVQARTSCRRKKPSAPMTPLGWRKITRPQPPLPAPPPPALFGNIVGSGNVASATSNSSSGPSGAHRFVVDASSSHIVDDATRNNSHINSNNQYFF